MYILQPCCGPTCKFARFQAELKFPGWTECANKNPFTLLPVESTEPHVSYLVNIRWVSEGSPLGVWRVSYRCLEGVWKFSLKCV